MLFVSILYNSQHAGHCQDPVVPRPVECDASVRWQAPNE